MISNTKTTQRESLAKRVSVYAAAATAATAIADDAQAAVIYENIQDVVIHESTPGFGTVTGFDLDNNGSIDFEFGHQLLNGTFGVGIAGPSENLSAFPDATTNQIAASSIDVNGSPIFYLQNLAIGTVIDSSLTSLSTLGSYNRGYLAYGAATDCPNCDFSSGTNGLIGVSFDAGGTTNYGWLRIAVDEGDVNRMTVLSYAYENSGAGIVAGTETSTAAVPEPGCLGLLALGGTGLMAWRRRRDA